MEYYIVTNINLSEARFSIRLNNYCNFKCIYCCNDIPYLKDNNIDLKYDIIYLLIKNINKYMKNINISFSLHGGEPLLNPEFNSILNSVNTTNNVIKILILTNNSTNIVNKLDIKDLKLNIIKFVITYHDGQKYNDNIFENNIKYFIENNIRYEINLPINLKLGEEHTTKLYNIRDYYINKYNSNAYISYLHPTVHYKIDNYDYSLTNEAYKNKTKEKYANRNFDIFADGKFNYSCPLIRKDEDYNYIELFCEFKKHIINNFNNITLCTDDKCACRRCFDIN